ncbi:MAG: GNAT family N-acetyltransferase [Cytophagales bacterium]|nr:GNAT family N-acetyltransferase [Cytophagales bacterium]
MKETKVISRIILLKENGVLRSTPYASFSFFEGKIYKEFIEFIIDWAKREGFTQILWKTPPVSYLKQKITVLEECFFTKKIIDYNFHFEVNEESFRQKIAPAQRSKLNKCEKAGFSFAETDMKDFDHIYQLCKACRDEKGYEISMTKEELRETIEYFPDNYKLFTVQDSENRMVAGTVCIHINSDILYTFYWGDDLKYRQYSPIVFLLKEVYEYAQNNQYKILDSGTSSINGQISEGTYLFKKRLGAKEEEKVLWEWSKKQNED